MTEMTNSECDWCEGAGQRFDPTDADKVNAGPFVGQCSHCRGTGRIVRIILELPAYLAAERAAAQPECDPNAELPSWMLDF